MRFEPSALGTRLARTFFLSSKTYLRKAGQTLHIFWCPKDLACICHPAMLKVMLRVGWNNVRSHVGGIIIPSHLAFPKWALSLAHGAVPAAWEEVRVSSATCDTTRHNSLGAITTVSAERQEGVLHIDPKTVLHVCDADKPPFPEPRKKLRWQPEETLLVRRTGRVVTRAPN